MAEDFDTNEYDGNSWIKYQKLVLEQLADHKSILKFLGSELIEIKTQMAVSAALAESWRTSVDKTMEDVKKDVKFILTDEKGLASRIKAIEDDHRFEARSSLKIKGLWALIGSGIIVAIDIGFKIVDHFFKSIP